MASEMLRLTAEIVTSHVSITELTPAELKEEIKEIYTLLSSLAEPGAEGEAVGVEEGKEAATGKKPPVALKDIVKEKYVVCLECGRKMRTLKAHLRKAHNLLPKEYYKIYNLDPKKYPLICKEYSEQRRTLAKEKGLGVGLRRKGSKSA